jgi:hypothetical protein
MRRLLSLIAVLAMFSGLAPFRTCPITGSAQHPAGLDGHGEHGGHTHAGDPAGAPSQSDPHGHGAECTELMRCHWAALPVSEPQPADELPLRVPVPLAMQTPALPPDPFAATPPPRSSS